MTLTVDLEDCLCPAEVEQEGEVCSCGGKRSDQQLQEQKWTDGLKMGSDWQTVAATD